MQVEGIVFCCIVLCILQLEILLKEYSTQETFTGVAPIQAGSGGEGSHSISSLNNA